MSDDDAEYRAREPLDWPRLARLESPPLVRQLDEDGCGVACATMLLLDRGIDISQEVVASGVALPSEAEDLAKRLEQLSPFRWSGGSLSEGTVINWELVEYISGARGSWAALLEPKGHRHIGHWVVVDGVAGEGLVLIRDPAGVAYGLPLGDFAELWGYTVLVVQKDSP